MVRSWRLLPHETAPGPSNMGLDEALLASVAAGGPPTLRFYRWQGAWLSLGYAQKPDAARRAACASAGIGLLRRATGGGAVLHGADLTYALAAPVEALPPGLGDSYARVAHALREALVRLGVRARVAAGSASRAGRRDFDCFAALATCEIGVGGRKLVGSAQRRAGSAVLQHGSIRLRPDPPATREAAGLAEGVCTSLRELGCGALPEEVAASCTASLEAALAARFEPSELLPAERQAAAARSALHRVDPFGVPSLAPPGNLKALPG